MKCPSCGTEDQSGKFCASCGAGLRASCASCGAELPPGSRFCTQCGAAIRPRGRGARGLPWPWVAGGALVVVVLLILLLPRRAERAGPPSMTDPGTGAAPAASAPPAAGPGLLSSDMRTNADRLYNRIMAAADRGDREEVARFVPMAAQAYGMVEDLDADGVYHLAVLHLTAGDPVEARATAERILRDSPRHVLALGVAAAAAEQSGQEGEARELYRRLLDAYAAEAARPLPEYLDHRQMLAEYRRAAREALGESG